MNTLLLVLGCLHSLTLLFLLDGRMPSMTSPFNGELVRAWLLRAD